MAVRYLSLLVSLRSQVRSVRSWAGSPVFLSMLGISLSLQVCFPLQSDPVLHLIDQHFHYHQVLLQPELSDQVVQFSQPYSCWHTRHRAIRCRPPECTTDSRTRQLFTCCINRTWSHRTLDAMENWISNPVGAPRCYRSLRGTIWGLVAFEFPSSSSDTA